MEPINPNPADQLEARNSFIANCLMAPKTAKPKSNTGIQHATRFYNHFHNLSNDFAGLARASKMMSEIWYTFSYNVTLAFSSTKFFAIVSVPADTIDCVDDVKSVFQKKSPVEKVVHGSGAVASAGNVAANLWTFLQGLNNVVSISQPALHFFDMIGPVGWGLNTLSTVKGGYRVYEDGQVNKAIDKTKPEEGPISDRNRYDMFSLFLLDENNNKIKHSDLMDKLRLTDRIPGLESKYKIRTHVETMAKGYMVTRDTDPEGSKKITDNFVKLVRKQYRMNQVFLALKVVAVVAGLAALLFLYVPALNHLSIAQHMTWSLLILGGTICLATAAAMKINSVLFVRELKKQAEPLREQAENWYQLTSETKLCEAHDKAIARLKVLKFNPEVVPAT